MSIEMILLPLFAQVVLTFLVLLTLGFRRYGAVKGNEVRGPVGLRESNWPEPARQAEYNYLNQFELPVLFYVLTALVIITRKGDLLFVLLAWLFVACRVLHAVVHLTSNALTWRAQAFGVSAIVLFAMWVIFILRILVLP